MPILTLQQRSRELGRIRIGQQVPTADGRTRPEKLDRFRLTSASKALIERVAELYGGEARDWDNNGSAQYEVITTAARLPVLVPPQPVSQYFELWSAGGCQRRCDGQTELLTDQPCICDPDPEERKCKPTTRLNVILRDVEGIGVFRLESHGYYSAVELPEVADFLGRAGRYVSAWLSLEQRTAIRDGKTRRWMVPTLEVDVTPAQLLAGTGPAGQDSATPPAIGSSTVALPDPVKQWVSEVRAAETIDQLRLLWRHRPAETLPPDAEQVFTERAAALRAIEAGEASTVQMTANAAGDDVDALWQQVLTTAPESWTTQEIENHFMDLTGIDAGKATAADVQRYLNAILAKASDQP